MTLARLTCLLGCAALALSGQTRRALVIGNTSYKNAGAAAQAANNARAIALALSASQFQVALLINVEAETLGREINKFLQEVQPGDTGAFCFSGYAVQDTGENYLGV